MTLHFPLEMGCVAAILKAVAGSYPGARMGENGEVWDGPPDTRATSTLTEGVGD